ncbi:protein GDAP2 homolog [Eriocheir sinensis]|uniref:protein GDAP2 homolog n=1 Tax=Eriocheir sinensis TaxID=95602 RepID=UPI0021C9AF24|nr:protein GDAP2 homolog [Eriocheir sinensis]XP_050689364.1 protein GDAP2 homolog [Eriocheir sinensis]XP_050689365.1 protein GDAP2 homolog [Eriocheir sinensis]
MEPLGINPKIVEVGSLAPWSATQPPHHTHASTTTTTTTTTSVANHATSPFKVDEAVNGKLCVWSGELSQLRVGAVVNSTNETLTEHCNTQLIQRAGPRIKAELRNAVKSCKTGEVRVTGGYGLPARYVIHTVAPRYNIKYHTASETALHMCYRRVLEAAVEKKIRSVAVCTLHTVARGYPPEQGAHTALRTVRRCLERWGGALDQVVMVVNSIDTPIYSSLTPLYFPRTAHEEEAARRLLPVDLGNEFGEPIVPDRQIRIIDNPQHKYEDVEDSADLAAQLQSSVSVGEHAFSHMEEDIDKQRLLGGQPSYATADPETASMTTDLQQKQRYERLLRRAKNEDLSEVSGIGCLYQCGLDKFGRPVVIFIGKWFRFNEINLDKALLYLISLLDPLVRGDYVVVYFHTITTTENHPSLSWIRHVYDMLEYKYKKNLKAFYIVHPTLWTKIMTWWFTTFMAPQIKHKVHSVPGVEYLYDIIDPDQLEIPAYITEHDMTINGIRYYRPVTSSS